LLESADASISFDCIISGIINIYFSRLLFSVVNSGNPSPLQHLAISVAFRKILWGFVKSVLTVYARKKVTSGKKMCIYWNLRHTASEHLISLVFSLSGLAFLKQFVKNGDDFLATYQLIIPFQRFSVFQSPPFYVEGPSIWFPSYKQL
jgi:hypothetical protein